MKTPKQKYTTFGLSFPDERVLEIAKQRARDLGMSLSAYVNHLIRKDVGLPGAFTHSVVPPIAGTTAPDDPSKIKPTLTNPAIVRHSAPLKYPVRDEPARFVAENGPAKKKKPR